MSKSYIGVIRCFDDAPDNVKAYFPDFVKLVEKYEWGVPVSYLFTRVEQAKRMAIYCGIVKLHECESALTRKLVSEDHMARGRFKSLFHTVYGRKIPDELIAKLEKGEKIRDKIAHGMDWTAKEAREGLCSTIEFAGEFNTFVNKHAGFEPFGSLQGFKGRAQPLSTATTHWVLRGMGIPQKNEG